MELDTSLKMVVFYIINQCLMALTSEKLNYGLGFPSLPSCTLHFLHPSVLQDSDAYLQFKVLIFYWQHVELHAMDL